MEEGSLYLGSLLPRWNNLLISQHATFCLRVWQVTSATQELIILHSMEIYQEQWVTLGKASQSSMLLILSILTYIKKVFPGNQSQLWERHLNLYRNMNWVFGKLPSLLETKLKISYKQTKTISKFTRKSLPLLLLFWFQADIWAQRVIEGKVRIEATILCQKNKTRTV